MAVLRQSLLRVADSAYKRLRVWIRYTGKAKIGSAPAVMGNTIEANIEVAPITADQWIVTLWTKMSGEASLAWVMMGLTILTMLVGERRFERRLL